MAKDKCEQWVKSTGRGNIGFHRCSRNAIAGSRYCAQHNKAFRRGMAKVAAYATQTKFKGDK